MNLTSIEKKDIIKIEPNKIQKSKKENFQIKKIEPKKIGIKNMMGSINPLLRNNRVQSNTISLAAKLSDISEKLEKYEEQINKFGKEFQWNKFISFYFLFLYYVFSVSLEIV